MKDLQEEYGISPAVGVIILLGITAALATVAGIVLLDIGDGLSQNAQAGVEVNETTEGVEVTWTTDNNAERIIVQVDGQRYTLNSVNDSITLGLNEGSNVSVIGVIDGEESVISETTTESDTGDGEVTEYETTDTNTVSGKVSINPDIPGATVKSIQYGNVVDSTTTDSSGNYTIESTEEATIYYIVSGFEYNSSDLYASTKRQPTFDSDVNVDFDETEIETVDTGSETVSVINTAQNGVIQIGSIYELQAFDKTVSEDYELVSEIDASETSSWNSGTGFTPIDQSGSWGNGYEGSFDGNGYTISNLTIDQSGTSNRATIFNFFDGQIQDLTIDNANITGGNQYGTSALIGVHTGDGGDTVVQNITLRNSTVTSSGSLGGIVGELWESSTPVRNVQVQSSTISSTDDLVGGVIGIQGYGPIEDVTVDSETSVTGSGSTGGIVGSFESSSSDITDSISHASVTGEGGTNVGGLAGEATFGDGNNAIVNSTATGSVSSNSNSVGGLVGNVDGVNVRKSKATGDISGSGYSIGGLVGLALSTTISDSHATGTVTNSDENSSNVNITGGLIGELEGTVTNSYATGDVVQKGVSDTDGENGGLIGDMVRSDISDSYATGDITVEANNIRSGGFVGAERNSDVSTITNSYATGNVEGSLATGGFGGDLNDITISNSYATGNVTGTGEDTGGFIGYARGYDTATIEDSYATGDVSGQKNTGGFIGLNTAHNITGVYYTGSVEGTDYVGGFIGNQRANFNEISTAFSGYTAASVTGDTNVGAVSGGADPQIDGADYSGTTQNVYWDSDIGPNTTFGNATSLTTSEMQGSGASSNMTNLDFDSTWDTTDQYPELQNNSE